MKSHIEAVHGDGDFNVKTWIKCGLRSFGLTFRTSRSARRVPQLAALALHTAGSTARAPQFAQSWFVFQYFIWITILFVLNQTGEGGQTIYYFDYGNIEFKYFDYGKLT